MEKHDKSSSQPIVILSRDVPSDQQPGDSTVSEGKHLGAYV